MEDIVTQYNELRNECLVLMDLRGLASAVDFELQNLRQTYKCLNPEGASVRSCSYLSSRWPSAYCN